jgi:hypothetical protein
MALLNDANRITRGIELNQLDAALTNHLAAITQISAQLDTLKTALSLTADKADVDTVKAKITAAMK